ncbi:MAG: VacJ family lipoprotein [Gammaproteobacteria bacterium]|nr:VacJ family lipoprotein [Gammaproteobacteria bacterium]
MLNRFLLLLITGLALSACASNQKVNPQDPWETTNRAIYRFNEGFDNYITRPVSTTYQTITPNWLNVGFSNFFNNLGDVPNSLNNLLQAKPVESLSDLGRVGINSTIGLAGLFDVATPVGLTRHNEDFGQTLAVWGFDSGNYLVLPLLGPSNIRDGIGWVGDFQTEPYYYVKDNTAYYSLFLLDAIDTRADLLSASRILEQASLDPYTFHRETYLQRRKGLIYDGNPPIEGPSLDELDLLDEMEITPAK